MRASVMPSSINDPNPLAEPAVPGLSVLSAQVRSAMAIAAALVVLTAGVERSMGRSLLGPDRKFGWWESNIWSQECSQRLADPYSFSHINHGILLYGALGLARRKLTLGQRFSLAVMIEAGWEILENSPVIIDRYREATMALGYDGDSIVNSVGDLMMMMGGFLLASRLRPWMSIGLLLANEIGCVLWIRDNLTLNVIMLLHPLEAIKAWQTSGRP